MNDCIFCNELATDALNIFHRSKSGLFASRWDQFPLVPGHVEVIPVRHIQLMKDLSALEQSELLLFTQEVIPIIESTDLQTLYMSMKEQIINDTSTRLIKKVLASTGLTVKPDAYNFGINDGPMAGQSVPHMHLHIMPRREGDVANPRGGVRNMFTGDPYSTL